MSQFFISPQEHLRNSHHICFFSQLFIAAKKQISLVLNKHENLGIDRILHKLVWSCIQKLVMVDGGVYHIWKSTFQNIRVVLLSLIKLRDT